MAVLYTLTLPATVPVDPGGSRARKPKVLMAEFGDGFSQRSRQGPNHNPVSRTLTFSNISKADKEFLDNFLLARGGEESFYFQERDEASPNVYICQEWEVIDVAYDIYTVRAVFQQVYDI